MKTPKVIDPSEYFYAAAYFDPLSNAWHPNPATIAETTSEAAIKSNALWGSRYKRQKLGIRIMRFQLQFIPAWVEGEEPEDGALP